MADEKMRRRERSRSIYQDDPDVRTFFGEPDPRSDFDVDFSAEPDSQAEVDADQLFGDTDRFMADAEALAGRINKRKSRKDHDSSSTRSKGSRRRRRPSLSRKAGSSKDKKWAKEDSYFETFSEKMSKAERRRDTGATKEVTASESAAKVEADGGTKPADFTKATTAEGTGERWSAAEPNEPAGTTASTAAAESTTRKGSKERSSKRRSKKRESDSAIQGFNVTDLAKVLLDVLEAEQQQLQQPQTQAISQTPCEVCIAARESSNQCMACEDSRSRDRPEVSRRGSWCDRCKTTQSDDRPDTPTRRGRRRPLRGRRRNRGVYYDEKSDEEKETYDEEDMVTRRKPRKVFARSKRGRRGKGRHASQRPLAIEETTSTKVVETRDQSRSPYAPWDPRLIHPPPGDGEPYYGEGYGPLDVCGPIYYPPPEDAFLDYFGDPMDPWSPQGYPYWCGPCGAGVPGEWPTPYAPHCPCVAAAAEPSPTQGTIVRREEVWTEGGRHRHRVQEVLEALVGGTVHAERKSSTEPTTQEAPSGFLRDGVATVGSQASTRAGAERPAGSMGRGRILLDAYEEIRPPGGPSSERLFPRPAGSRQSATRAAFSRTSQQDLQAGMKKSESAVPRGRVLYWEEDTYPVRIYAPSEPAVMTEHKKHSKKSTVEGTPTARRASTVELGNLLRSRRAVPILREPKRQPFDGQQKVPQWIRSTSPCPDSAGQWQQAYTDREGGSGTYYLDMTWSTNQVDAWQKNFFSWSTKKAAEKRLHKAAISLSERKKQKTKSSSKEKLSGAGTSLHQTQKGITATVSSPTARSESARSTGSSDSKSAVALEPCSDLTSPAAPQAQATSTASTASARRLPGKAKAATWLSRRASLAKTSRDMAATSKLKQEPELLSPPLSVSGSKSAIAGSPLPPLEKGMSSIGRGEDGAEKVGTPENYGAEAKATSKQSKSRASSTGTRRPSTVIANQSQEENTERMTMAEAGTIRTKKLKADIQTDVSDSGGSTKAEGPPKEDLFGSAPGSPYVTPSPSAISAAGEGKPSKISIASKACNNALKAASAESSSTDENEQVSKPTPEAEPKEEGDVSVAVAMVAVEEPDTDSKQDMNEILRELEKQTTVIYPESNLVVVIGILCILWICLLLFLTSHKYTSKTTIWPTSAFPTWPPYHSSTVRPSVVPRSHVYICSTDFCVKEGEHIAGLFSHDVSPCDNFYRYVCRHWERIMYNPAMGLGVATSIDTLLQDAMHTEVLEYILDSSHDDVSEAKRLYEACAAPHTSSSVTELRHILSMWPPIGQWPVNSKVTVSEFDVWSVAARLSREFGLAALLGVEAALDKTFGKHVIELQLPQPLFFRDDEQRKAIVSMFRGAITESAQLTQSSGMVYELMSDIMAVFKSIAKRRPIFPGMEVKLVTVNNLDSGIRTFLTVVFEGTLEGNATVQYRNIIYFEHELSELFREVGPRALINYLGFRLLVRLAPFLPETTNLLRLHSIESIGRVLSPMTKWVLCLRAVASVLPVCVVKAHARLTIVGGSDLTNRAWLSQLESLFFRSSRNYAWMDSLTHRVTRFMLRRVRLARFYPQWSLKRDTCAGGALPPSGGPIHMLHEASRLYQNQRLAQFTRRTRPRDVGDAFGILARFNPGQQAVYVPFGIVNTTVPGNGTVFAFELSRMATRLFAGLVPVVLEDGVADESALLTFTDAAVRKLDQLLDCLTRDYRNLPLPLREGSDDSFVDADRARYVLLAQTAAVALAHAAFQELLHVKRIWKYDFRLAPLPDLTSEQLFFAYFARDNCECSDDAHKAHDYVINARLPPEQRVNFALRHLPAFGEAFHCSRDAPMRPLEGSVCRVFDYLPSYLPDI